jgi:hypothetical protein
MLENLSDQVRECLRLAEDSARKAASQRDPKLRQDFLDMEARWLLLARSFELSQRLNAFSQQAQVCSIQSISGEKPVHGRLSFKSAKANCRYPVMKSRQFFRVKPSKHGCWA